MVYLSTKISKKKPEKEIYTQNSSVQLKIHLSNKMYFFDKIHDNLFEIRLHSCIIKRKYIRAVVYLFLKMKNCIWHMLFQWS